jgi:cAMP-dependent protein kinase regulator
VYIIRSGRVKAVKRVKWLIEMSLSLKSISNDRAKTLKPLEEEYVEIDELGDGELFGDFALLNEQELECSYITAIPSEII